MLQQLMREMKKGWPSWWHIFKKTALPDKQQNHKDPFYRDCLGKAPDQMYQLSMEQSAGTAVERVTYVITVHAQTGDCLGVSQ